jgi:hypothetical protein
MPEFMVMVLANEAEEARLTPAETRSLVEGHSQFERSLGAAFRDGERLRPSAEARRVSLRDGRTHVETGPFGELSLGGYYLVQAENLDAAVALAMRCPIAPGTSLDVRPVMGGHMQPGKNAQQGRVFGFAVLGNAANEAGWIAIMDRIDAATRDGFPADRFLGGARLHAPTKGKKVSANKAIFDGPFLESKEVIGGIFFLRMETMDEAIRWASQSEFMKHGSLEIRELWRS